nr:collagen alpha-1(XXVI) chain-like [Procambarus clarkii]
MRERCWLRQWWCVIVLSVCLMVCVVVSAPGDEEGGTGRPGYRRRQQVPRHTGRNAVAARGNVCPYTVSKMVSCKVTNGTETYTGKVAIGKRVQFMTMTRPRYVTSFKEVQDTEYGCCPGFYGDNCDNCELYNY